MSPQHEERIVQAFEHLVMALQSIALTLSLPHPNSVRGPVRDIEITKPLSAEDKLRAAQGSTGEATTEEWMQLDDDEEDDGIGPRERAFMEREKARRREEAATEERTPGSAD